MRSDLTDSGSVVICSMKVMGYVRVSGAGQVDKDGPIRQAEKIKAFCEEHNLEQVLAVHDLAVTGTMDGLDRPGFAGFMAAFDDLRTIAHTCEAIVVERNDRFARDLVVSELMLKELRARGLKLFFCDQGLVDQGDDAGDPTKTLIRQILAALAEWDRSMQVLKLAGARARMRAATGRCEGVKPYGTLGTEQQILDIIVTMRKQDHTFAFIAEMLNQGRLTNRRGGKWSAPSVQSVLANKRRRDVAALPPSQGDGDHDALVEG